VSRPVTYRVIQWGTGNVGRHAVRAILGRPNLELVGLRVYNPEKVGVDAGAIVGSPATGVVATDDVDSILALDADCVNYSALGATEDARGGVIDDLERLLRAGFNVTSSAPESLVYPKAAPREVVERLERACADGQSSLFVSGVNPGFTMDVWPITMTRLSREIDSIRVTEVLDMVEYTSASAMYFMGFGQSPDAPAPLDTMHSTPETSPFYASLVMTADAIGFELEDYRYEREVGLAKEKFEVKAGTIERGTIAVVKMGVYGIARGRDVLINEWVWRISDDVRADWGIGEQWTMQIEGDPSMTLSMEPRTRLDSGRVVSLTVATAIVNAIPSVCDAAPGLRSPLDLPLWGGGYLS
jgi:4-hydroxy-tetrahydrodipicolinate reductase